MTATVVPVQDVARGSGRLNITDVSPVTGNATDGHTMVNDGHTLVLVRNTDNAVDYTVAWTVAASAVDGTTAGTVTPAAYVHGKDYWEGPFPTDKYGTTLRFKPNNAAVTFKAMRVPLA
jgi:hypothetical protein